MAGLRGTTEFLRVVALNPDGLASPPAQLAARIAPRPLPVSAPAPLASTGRTQTQLLWRWPAQPHAVAYRARLTHVEGGHMVVDDALSLDAAQTRLATPGLWPATAYTLSVWAVSNVGRWSPPALLRVPTLPMALPPPRDPRAAHFWRSHG
jgi:hypothetical protein